VHEERVQRQGKKRGGQLILLFEREKPTEPGDSVERLPDLGAELIHGGTIAWISK
jgi:hypothetical protein